MTKVAVTCCGLLIGCAGGGGNAVDAERASPPPVGQSTAVVEESVADNACPIELGGVDVTAEVTPDGAALVFTSEAGDVSELQDRVQEMAERHNRRSGVERGPAMEDEDPGPDDTGMMDRGAQGMDMHGREMEGAMVGTRAHAEDLDNGARLVLVPRDPSDLPGLREHVRAHVHDIAAVECPAEQQRDPQARLAPPPERSPSPIPDDLSPERPVPDRPIVPDPTVPEPPDQPEPIVPDAPQPLR